MLTVSTSGGSVLARRREALAESEMPKPAHCLRS